MKALRRLTREFTTATRRFSCVRGQRENRQDPDLDQLRSASDPLLGIVRGNVQAAKYVHLDAKKPPWTATGIEVKEGQEVSVFATGRLWLSRLRDLWPAATWRDRELHVVVRSGTAELGVWLLEKRNISEDYKRYIGDPPERLVRVWLIAGSRWQRFKGDMSVKNIKLASPRGTTDVT